MTKRRRPVTVSGFALRSRPARHAGPGRLRDRPIGERSGAVDIVEFRDAKIIRDLIVSAPDEETEDRWLSHPGREGVQVLDVADRTFYAPGGRSRSGTAFPEEPGRPGDGLHARRRPGLRSHPGESPPRLRPHPQAEYRGHRDGRVGRPGPREYRLAAAPCRSWKARPCCSRNSAGERLSLCLDNQDPDEIVAAVKWIAPSSAASTWRHYRAPVFRGRRTPEGRTRHSRLSRRPARHGRGDPGGLVNALTVVGKPLGDVAVVVNGLARGRRGRHPSSRPGGRSDGHRLRPFRHLSTRDGART